MTAGTALAAVLVTDAVGSTQRRVALGEQLSDELQRTVDRLTAERVAAHGGTVVKHLGDGTLAWFASAADAVAAAIEVQRQVSPHTSLRIGVSLGDVVHDEGDVSGLAVVEASRLCTAATADQVLASDLVRMAAQGRCGDVFTPVGALELKGLPTPVPASEVSWTPVAEPEVIAGGVMPHLPLPGAVSASVSTAFVGRGSQLSALRARWDEARRGESAVALVAGEPGAGKTRLAAELAAGAHGDGGVVLLGRCDDEAGIPYQPFVEALRPLATLPPDAHQRLIEPLVDGLGPVLPVLAPRNPAEVARTSDLDSARVRVFESIVGLLRAIAAERPVLLVLDDLHWADPATLLVLRHLLRADVPRLLVLGLYRDTELGRTRGLADLLADVRREDPAKRIALGGLEADDVADLLEVLAGHELDADSRTLAAAVHAETDGNAFFVGEVMRHLVATGAVREEHGRWRVVADVGRLGIPEGVREVLGRRLGRLPEGADHLLTIGSVMGAEFDVTLLCEVAGGEVGDVLGLLEAAERDRLVAPVPGRPDRYTFAHALVRTTLYEELSTARRVLLHRQVAQAIERRSPMSTAELARHYGEAAPMGEVRKAIDYARAAAHEAHQRLAFESSIEWLDRALALVALDPNLDDGVALDLQIDLGDALLRDGDARGRAVLEEAGKRARARGDVDRIAGVAGAFSRNPWTLAMGVVDELAVPFMREALALLPPGDSSVRALVLSGQTSALAFSPEWTEEVRGNADEALAMARRLGDREVVSIVLQTNFFANGPDRARQHLESCQELLTLAREVNDVEIEFWAYGWMYAGAGMVNDVGALKRSMEMAESLAVRVPTRPTMGLLRGMRGVELQRQGRFDDAMTTWESATAELSELAPSRAAIIYAGGIFTTRYYQGRLAEIEPMLRSVTELAPGIVGFTATAALAALQSGAPERAHDDIRSLAEDGFEHFPRDGVWLPGMVGIQEVVTAVGDTDLAATMFDLLSPYSGLSAFLVTGEYGPIDRALGALASDLGNFRDADRYFDQALADVERMGSMIHRPRIQACRADSLAQRGERGMAADIAGAALPEAESLGMVAIAARLRAHL